MANMSEIMRAMCVPNLASILATMSQLRPSTHKGALWTRNNQSTKYSPNVHRFFFKLRSVFHYGNRLGVTTVRQVELCYSSAPSYYHSRPPPRKSFSLSSREETIGPSAHLG